MITKTDFVVYLDAPRHLWALKHNKISRSEVNAFLSHLFEQGYDVEKYANKYIQEHLLAKYETKEYQLQPTATHENYEARSDALIKNPKTNKWDVYEIKSSNSIDKAHIYDVTFQVLVFEKHFELGDIYILHLNKEYVRQGELNLAELFVAENVTEKVKEVKDIVEKGRYDAYLIAKTDKVETTLHCYKPKTCICADICHPNLPKYSIYDVNRLTLSKRKIDELEENNIYSVMDIPKEFPLTDLQRKQVDTAQKGTVHIEKEMIRESLENLVYPLYFLDYESFNPAIPLFDGYRPYDQMTFQYSLHIKESPDIKELKHCEFLETKPIDTIPNFLESLKSQIGTNGSIIVWNKSFECTQNKRMGEIHPEYQELVENMNMRIYDLMEIFQKQFYIDNRAKGSYSIKQILPIFDSSLNYKEMSIGDGATAMTTWNKLVHKGGEESEQIRNDLLRYCELDTLAMVKVFEGLEVVSFPTM